MQRLNIAIDGPAGAGKSTVAKAVAARLGIRYLDTGAMYRAMALWCLRRGVPVHDAEAVGAALPGAEIAVRYTDAGQRVLLSGEDVTDGLRAPELAMAASAVSAHPAVRVRLTELQRQVAAQYDVIMDGRDIGTNVLPDTPHKFYLTASAYERAKRRFDEMRARGQACGTVEDIAREIAERDYNDSHRAFMPLRQADDAVLIDTTGMSIEAVVGEIVRALGEECDG